MEDNAQHRNAAALHPKKRIAGKAGHKSSPSISEQNKTIEPSGDEAARQNRALYRLTRRIAQSGNEVDRIAQSAAELVAEVIGDLCVISLLNSHSETIHIAAFHDSDPAAKAMLQEVLDATADFPRDQGMGARVLRSGQPLLIPSIPPQQLEAVAIPAFTQYIKQVGMESVLWCQ